MEASPWAEGQESWWAPWLVAATAILVYLNSVSNGFAYDDLGIILENPAVRDLGNPLRTWLTPYWPGSDAVARGLYRPLTVQLMAIEWAMGGGSPLPFHAFNVLLHSFASVLVYLLLRGLVGWKGALIGSLLFAVHPVHVEAVANGVGQAELLSGFLFLAAVLVYAGRGPAADLAPWRHVLLPVLFLTAVLAKENAVVLPAVLLAVDAAQKRPKRPGYFVPTIKMLVLLLGTASVYLALRFLILGGSLSGEAASENQFLLDPVTRVRTALSIWPEYARLLFFPFHLSAMYDPGTILPAESTTPAVLLGGTLLVIVAFTSGLPRAWPAMGLGSMWFLVTVLPVSNLIVPIGTILAERTLYLPSVAVAIWSGYACRWVWNRATAHAHLRRSLAAAAVTLILAFGGRVILRNPVWANNEVLFTTTLRDHPENFRAHWFRAQRLMQEGDSVGSSQHWDQAFRIYQGHTGFLTGYAHFLLTRGDLERAGEMVDRALSLRPDAPNGIFLRGLVDIAERRPWLARTRIEALDSLGLATMARALQDSLEGRASLERPRFPPDP